jgi:hypothetical protein
MGPPKEQRRKLVYSERIRRYNCFEYRWDGKSGAYYLFNPYSGETICSTNYIDRTISLWGRPDLHPSEIAETINVLPEFYLSRRWGRRRFNGWKTIVDAAVHITSVARGYLARVNLRRYFTHRYYKKFDSYAGYFYFVDRFNEDPETNCVWHKPTLAFPDDIREYVAPDPHDYLQGFRFSKQSHMRGPLITVAGLSKYDVQRVEIDEFLIPNHVRSHIAIRHYNQIDWTTANLNDVVAWFDGEEICELHFNEFHLIRAAIEGNDWYRVLEVMHRDPENSLLQMYGFHTFSKAFLPMNEMGSIDDVRIHRGVCIAVFYCQRCC